MGRWFCKRNQKFDLRTSTRGKGVQSSKCFISHRSRGRKKEERWEKVDVEEYEEENGTEEDFKEEVKVNVVDINNKYKDS